MRSLVLRSAPFHRTLLTFRLPASALSSPASVTACRLSAAGLPASRSSSQAKTHFRINCRFFHSLCIVFKILAPGFLTRFRLRFRSSLRRPPGLSRPPSFGRLDRIPHYSHLVNRFFSFFEILFQHFSFPELLYFRFIYCS